MRLEIGEETKKRKKEKNGDSEQFDPKTKRLHSGRAKKYLKSKTLEPICQIPPYLALAEYLGRIITSKLGGVRRGGSTAGVK